MITLKVLLNSHENRNCQFSKRMRITRRWFYTKYESFFKNYIFFNDKVKPPIIMCLSLKIFQYFLHSLIKLKKNCVIRHANLKATNVLWTLKVMEQCRKYRKRINDNLVQSFWKNSSRPSLVSAPYLSHFELVFNWLKIWWVHELRFHKNSLYSKSNDAWSKILNFDHHNLF
jgi:hypothetical protein